MSTNPDFDAPAAARHHVDARGCAVSGATDAALQRYEVALAAFQTWRRGVEPDLGAALHEAPGFGMAHVLQGYVRVCSRDPRRVQSARPVVARAAGLPGNRFEREHLAALQALLDDDYELAKSRLSTPAPPSAPSATDRRGAAPVP